METGEKTFVIKLYMLISILEETEVAVCSVPVTSVHIKDVTAADGSDQDVQCSFSLSVLKHHFSLADSDSTACTLKRLITVLQGKSFVYDIQTPKQDACFSLLYSHHTTSQTSQDMSPIKSQGSSPTFYTESCTVEQAQS